MKPGKEPWIESPGSCTPVKLRAWACLVQPVEDELHLDAARILLRLKKRQHASRRLGVEPAFAQHFDDELLAFDLSFAISDGALGGGEVFEEQCFHSLSLGTTASSGHNIG
jgi:hypothetical protein